MNRSYAAVIQTCFSAQNTTFQHGKRRKEAQQVSALTTLLLQGWGIATHISAGLETEECPSLAPTSLPPSVFQWCLWMGKSEKQVCNPLGLGRREVVPTEDSSSYKISAFTYSCMLAAAVWKCLLSTATHSLNFHHEKPVTPLAHAVAPCISCLLVVALKFLLLKLVIPCTTWKYVSCVHNW